MNTRKRYKGRTEPIGVGAMNIITIAVISLSVSQFAYSQRPNKTHAGSSGRQGKAILKLRAAYAAFNRADFDAAVAPLDPEIEWNEPLEFPGGGTYRGRQAVKQYLMQSRAGWAEGSSEPERFITARDRIVVFVYARFRPRETNEWQQVKLADVYTVRKGRIVQMNAFADRHQALDWAGAKILNDK